PPSAEVCLGSTQEFCAAVGMASYSWTGPNGFTASSRCITVGEAGDYTVTIKNDKGCESTCKATLVVNEHPACQITPPSAETCLGSTVQFCAPAGMASYAWTGPNGFTAATQCITVGGAGDYTVTIKNDKGCESTCKSTLIVNEHPASQVTPASAEVCLGSTQQFCAPEGMASYAWTGPKGFTASTQ